MKKSGEIMEMEGGMADEISNSATEMVMAEGTMDMAINIKIIDHK